MKAAYLLDGRVEVGDMADPSPAKGQVLVRTHRCGLCASDLHLCQHGPATVEWSRRYGGNFSIDLSRPLVMGHEYLAEIVDYGPGTERVLPIGSLITSQPAVTDEAGRKHTVGLDNDYPGGFGELMLLDQDKLVAVPSTRDSDLAALAEPIGVGLGYVRSSRVQPGDPPLVVGCGAIGLALIAALKIAGIAPIIAADFDERRRNLALASGADIVVDPREVSPYAPLARFDGRVPDIVFECVGTPGVLSEIILNVAASSRIVVIGWCLSADTIWSAAAHMKRLNIQFGGGTSPEAFQAAVDAILEGRIDPTPWLAPRIIGLSEVGASLAAMADPASPIRTLVDPRMA